MLELHWLQHGNCFIDFIVTNIINFCERGIVVDLRSAQGAISK